MEIFISNQERSVFNSGVEALAYKPTYPRLEGLTKMLIMDNEKVQELGSSRILIQKKI